MKLGKTAIVATLSLALSTTAIVSPIAAEANPQTPQFWWPELLDLSPLRAQGLESDPTGGAFDYETAFNTLDLNEVKRDIEEVLTTSQDWWPADYGHYGPFFIRLAWHAAGTYRVHDGRGGAGGGQQRFEPLNSWPDNANLDKARRLLWPLKKKYGRNISWGDLIALTGNVALESMGFKTYGFAGGREDVWEADLVYWGPEKKFLTDKRYNEKGELEKPLAAVEQGLIYVNPQGPHGVPDPLLAARDIRLSFGRMAMNDEEIVALLAGGHTFGKAHGAKKKDGCIGADPATAGVEEQGFGWQDKCGKGNAEETFTSGFEGAWTVTPVQWTTNYLDNLFGFDWVQTKSPSGAIQWIPSDDAASQLVPDAHDPTKRHAPIMFTTDIAIKEDPGFRAIAESFLDDPDKFELAFAKAWFKLNHRDLGPRARYLGSEVPQEALIWQDPIPEVDHELVNSRDIKRLKKSILESGLTVPELIRTAWASAASYRGTDMRGGANGARVRLAPQKDWAVNNPSELARTLAKLEEIQREFNEDSRKRKISLADTIVLAGAAAVEKAAEDAGYNVSVPFKPGRADASQEMTDVKSFNFLEPQADGFRNYYNPEHYRSPVESLVDRAAFLELSIPEMTALVGGMRALGANSDGVSHGILTDRPGVLSNDFFVNLIDMSTKWDKSETEQGVYQGVDRRSNQPKWTATSVDLIFGSNAELRAVAEYYAEDESEGRFVSDFVNAWAKVMTNDRFDLN